MCTISNLLYSAEVYQEFLICTSPAYLRSPYKGLMTDLKLTSQTELLVCSALQKKPNKHYSSLSPLS